MNLFSDLQYADNDIAKKVLLDTPNGVVLELAFDKGKGLDTHIAPGDVLVQVLEGSVVFTVAGLDNDLEKGDYIKLAPGVQHSVKATTRAKVLVTKILNN